MIAGTDNYVILALCNNSTDEDAFRPLLNGLPGVMIIKNPEKKDQIAQQMAMSGVSPSLVIISSRLYPVSRPEMVAEIRELCPGAVILLVTIATDPLPPLEKLAFDRISHLLVTPVDIDQEGLTLLQVAIIKLLVRTPWELLDYVRPGSRVHEIRMSSSTEKETLISTVESAISGNSPEMEMLRQRAALLADEMVENALYGAPQGGDGKKLYRKGEERALTDEEKILFRFAFDGETLAMEIADGWGTLSPEVVVDFLARNQEGSEMDEDAGGRGLFIIWRFMDHLHINIRPGMQTVLGGHLKAVSTFDSDGPKGFSISTDYM